MGLLHGRRTQAVLYLPGHARPWPSCGSFLQAHGAGWAAVLSDLSALNKGTASPLLHFSLALLPGGGCGSRPCTGSWEGRGTDGPCRRAAKAATAAPAHASLWRGWSSSYTWLLLSAIFSCWVWAPGFVFSFFFWKEKRKRSVSLQDMCNTRHVEGEDGLFLMKHLLFGKLQTTMPLGWCKIYLSSKTCLDSFAHICERKHFIPKNCYLFLILQEGLFW